MRVVALLATFNEQRFIAGCIEHLTAQGVSVYVIDNDSTDGTAEIAERYLGRGVIGIEAMPRRGHFDQGEVLRRKEELAASLDADWFMHVDADERRHPPDQQRTLGQAFSKADAQGFNAVNFLEFPFVPTTESPDHDHPDFETTMRWYYPLVPMYPHRLNAWKRQAEPVDLVSAEGHRVAFPGLRMAPRILYLRHYLFLSVDHACEKYARQLDPERARRLRNHWRVNFDAARVKLPSERELRRWTPGEPLDRSEPSPSHLAIAWTPSHSSAGSAR